MKDLEVSFVRKMEESRGRKRRVKRRPVGGVNVAQRPAAGGRHDNLQGQRSNSSTWTSSKDTDINKRHCKNHDDTAAALKKKKKNTAKPMATTWQQTHSLGNRVGQHRYCSSAKPKLEKATLRHINPPTSAWQQLKGLWDSNRTNRVWEISRCKADRKTQLKVDITIPKPENLILCKSLFRRGK